MLAGVVNLARVCAQSATNDWEKAAGRSMAFEVVSVKQDVSGPDAPVSWNIPPTSDDSFSPTGGLFATKNLPVIHYIAFAYKLTFVQNESIATQLPAWAKKTRFDIMARGPTVATKDQFRLMLQTLLADRFKLAVHYQTKQVPVFALELIRSGKLGPNLRLYKDDSAAPCTTSNPQPDISPPTLAGGFPIQCGTLVVTTGKTAGIISMRGRAVTAASLADIIGSEIAGLSSASKPVVDRTGLPKVDFVIDIPAARSEDDATRTATFLEALKEQLGLRLDSTTGPVETLVIDHIEEPSPN